MNPLARSPIRCFLLCCVVACQSLAASVQDSVSAASSDLAGTRGPVEKAAVSPGQDAGASPFKPGDAVRITALPDTGLLSGGIFPIDDSGQITLPILGKTAITHMTQAQLASYLNGAYVKYLRVPSLQVEPLIRVSLLGGFVRPGLYYASPRSSVWAAVLLAGGPVREDGILKLRWERSRQVVSCDLVAPFESGRSLAELGFRSGDQLCVTAHTKEDFSDVFRGSVLPVLGLAVSVVSASATAILAYQVYKGR
jgi:protein involved in polysaccharide export with SLBB domain